MRKASALFLLVLLSCMLLIGCGGGNSTTDGPASPTIAALKNPSSLTHPTLDTAVMLRNVLVTAVNRKSTYSYFWVEDATGGTYSGIYVYSAQAEIGDVARGDKIDLYGTYTCKNGFDQITLDHYTIQSRGNELPEPVQVTTSEISPYNADASRYEGVLVKVSSVQVSDPGPGEFTVGASVIIGNFLYSYPVQSQETFTSITGICIYNSAKYKILPRDENDIVSAGTDTVVQDVTISQVRNPSAANHPALSSKVRLSGVVTAIGRSMFWVQDPAGETYSGIAVHVPGDVDMSALAPGDAITLEGDYSEYYGLSEITLDSYQKTSSGNPLPNPVSVQPDEISTGGSNAEEYESMLVRVNSAIVTNTNPNPANTNEFEVANTLLVGDQIYTYDQSSYQMYTTFASLTGVLYCTNYTYKLLPRSAADLVLQ